MNRLLISTLSILICVFLQVQNSIVCAQEPKDTTYAVFVYCDKSVTTPINALRSELVSSLMIDSKGKYNVADRTEEILNLLKQEYKYEGSGMVREDQLIAIGEHLAVNFVCAIGITYYQDYNQWFFDCNIVNMQDRRIMKHSHYPDSSNGDSIVSSLDPQTQIKVGKDLSRQLGLTKAYKVGDYFTTVKTVTFIGRTYRIDDFDYRVGYIDKDGVHGIAYCVLGPTNKNKIEDRQGNNNITESPTITDLKLICTNRSALELYGNYWSRERSEPAESLYNKKRKKDPHRYFYTIDFLSKEIDVTEENGVKECSRMLIIRF